ncbi:MAG: hypothetical protein KJ971_02645 [Firmicutes bacterium]|nr:hypothetical protein [Bacillota bacterium]
MIVSYYKDKRLDSVDEVMCKLKKHLFKLAAMFKFDVLLHSDKLFNNIYEGCQIKASRFEEDIELSNTLKKLSCKYTFMEPKKIKDDDKETYLRIKE